MLCSFLTKCCIIHHNVSSSPPSLYSLLIEQEAPLIRLQSLEVGHGVGAEVEHQPRLGLALGLHLLELEVGVNGGARPLVEGDLLVIITMVVIEMVTIVLGDDDPPYTLCRN